MPASVVFCIRTTFFLTTDNRVLRTQPRTAIWSVEILPLGNVLRMPTGIQLKEHALLSHLYWVLLANKAWRCVGKIWTTHVCSSINVVVRTQFPPLSQPLALFILALSLLSGTTVLSAGTTVAGSATVGLSYPYAIIVNKTTDNAIIVTDSAHSRVLRFYDNRFTSDNVSLLAQSWSGGNSLALPFGIAVNPNQRSDLYVSDNLNHVVVKFTDMQVISPLPTVVAGVKGTTGNGGNSLASPAGIAVDRNGNLFVADSGNHRIMFWPVNSTTGTVAAGLGIAGNGPHSLNAPLGVFLDANDSYMYVCDSGNHRIQRFALVGGLAVNNGTTVAGGNGAGSTSQQLNSPYSYSFIKEDRGDVHCR